MKRVVIVFIAIFSLSISGLVAQDLATAADIFNQGIQFSKDENYQQALASYEQTIKICSQLGEEGMELQLMAEQQLPGTYYNMAKGIFDEKRYSESIPYFEKAAQYAEKMGEDKTVDASYTYLAGIYTAKGNTDLKNDDFDGALEKYNLAISYKEDYYKAHYGLGLVYKKQENLSAMKASLDKVIALAGDDEKTIGNAKSAAASAYQKAGALALQDGKYSDGIENLTMSLQYDDKEARTYFYLAIASNAISKWDDAIEYAGKALGLQTEDKSDIYFELAKAYENKGDAASACENYRNVSAGNNVAAAKYQIEQVLKCQ